MSFGHFIKYLECIQTTNSKTMHEHNEILSKYMLKMPLGANTNTNTNKHNGTQPNRKKKKKKKRKEKKS